MFWVTSEEATKCQANVICYVCLLLSDVIIESNLTLDSM